MLLFFIWTTNGVQLTVDFLSYERIGNARHAKVVRLNTLIKSTIGRVENVFIDA